MTPYRLTSFSYFKAIKSIKIVTNGFIFVRKERVHTDTCVFSLCLDQQYSHCWKFPALVLKI